MADTTNRIAGTAYLAVDGRSLMVQGAFEYGPGKVARESLPGMDGVHGYSEKPIAAHIAATLRDAGGLSVASLNDMTNVTVTCQLANGKLIIGRNMWTVESQSSKAEDATIEVRWEGMVGAVTEN